MKTPVLAMVAVLSLAPWTSIGATNVAQVRMFCVSIRFEPAVDSVSGLYSLKLTSAPDTPMPNGELFLSYTNYVSWFVMEAPDFPESLVGEIDLVVPDTVDVDTNGIPDIYDVTNSLPTTLTSGAFYTAVDSGTVAARWQRPAGSHRGTCVLTFTGDTYGQLPVFTHTIQVFEYDGTLTYTPATNNIPSAFDLTQVGDPTLKLKGPLVFTRNPTNSQNLLSTVDVTWTNGQSQSLTNSYCDIEPEPGIAMSYFGVTSFLDGDPNTPEMDYELFYIGINDPNDADHDGIPDLSDDVGTSPPARHTLSIARSGSSLNLTIAGEAGRTYALERTLSLTQTNWITVTNVTLASATQTAALPVPAGPTSFWRASTR